MKLAFNLPRCENENMSKNAVETVHYLSPSRSGGLVYPREADADGYGSLYLLGQKGSGVLTSYVLPVVDGVDIVEMPLIADVDDVFRVDVECLGVFRFRAVPVPSDEAAYTGDDWDAAGLVAIRRLDPLDPDDLELAALERNVVFVGYAPH
jgi:hypothetical protein